MVRFTDLPDMTIAVYFGHRATKRKKTTVHVFSGKGGKSGALGCCQYLESIPYLFSVLYL